MMVVILLILSLSPGVAIAFYIYLKDIHEPEPFSELAKAFFYGVLSMLLATAIASLLNERIRIDHGSMVDMAVKAFFIVALVEEGCKFLMIRGVLYRSHEFNEPFDGIIYSVIVAMGFAMTENVLYVMNGDGGTALVRMFSAVPAHATFGVLMGFFLGEAKLPETNTYFYSSLAILTAVLFHGIYDYFLFMSIVPGIWIGSIVSLAVAVVLSHKAMKIHQDASPFKESED